MTPEGPYVSPWTSKPFFIVRTLINNNPSYVTVPNGAQPYDGIQHLGLRDARQWMGDNGFTIRRSDVQP